jgi:hypothetical protein
VSDMSKLESIATEVIETFDIKAPPIPIESMLQHPKPDMWQEVDIVKLSGGFLSVKEIFSPRMSLARLLARHIASSEWGKTHDIQQILNDEDQIYAFARMLIMPIGMVKALSIGTRAPATMSFHFEVPEEDARLRLTELADYL